LNTTLSARRLTEAEKTVSIPCISTIMGFGSKYRMIRTEYHMTLVTDKFCDSAGSSE